MHANDILRWQKAEVYSNKMDDGFRVTFALYFGVYLSFVYMFLQPLR